ncbi:MAG: hypothetical protein IKL00_06030 [Oscillospiraceae bacterium]|nr:hypothetical protein [Oscillospiraceae bacterium]
MGACNTIIVTPAGFTTLFANFPDCPYLRRALLVDVIASGGYNPDALTCNLLKPKIKTAFVGLLMP